jgi:AraC-like DNA-binding protein
VQQKREAPDNFCYFGATLSGVIAVDRHAIENLLMPVTYGRHLARLFPADKLFAGTGLALGDLDAPDCRISVRQALQYIENTRALAEEPDWYLDWARTLSDHFHGPISVALMSAPTLVDGFDVFLRYFPSRIPYMHLQCRAESNRLRAELWPLIDLGASLPMLVETPLLVLMQYLQTVYDIEASDMALEFAYPAPIWADRYRRYFHGPLTFDAPCNALSIPLGWRARPNMGYLDSTWAHALKQCEALLSSSRERSTLGELRNYLSTVFERADRTRSLPTLVEVATHLHLAPRTLIRRLRHLGLTYQQIVDDFLRSRSAELLANDALKVKEVAAALGFNNPANFGKAFKRWHGLSPGEFRNRHLAPGNMDRRSIPREKSPSTSGGDIPRGASMT